MTQPNLKRAARLDTKAVALASLPFMGMISFWQVYDGIVPKMLTGTFGLSNSLTGAIMSLACSCFRSLASSRTVAQANSGAERPLSWAAPR